LIEVRTSSSRPVTLANGFVIDSAWRHLSVQAGLSPLGINIPVRPGDRDMLSSCGLVSRVAAEAHRWAFLAAMEASSTSGALCIETRLVMVSLEMTYTTWEIGVSDVVTARFGQRAPEFHPRPAFVSAEKLPE
jgi:hypothetical protein